MKVFIRISQPGAAVLHKAITDLVVLGMIEKSNRLMLMSFENRKTKDITRGCVAQPPPAVPPPTRAKPTKGFYRRNLPHLQAEDKIYFVTFATYKRWQLPESVRGLIIKHCLHDHGIKIHIFGIVIMPDHVHMIFAPLKDGSGNPFGLSEIMNGIKGASAHSINKFLNRRGPVWQDESFDHILRSDEKAESKVEYICQNPVRKGLVKEVDDYAWLWRDWAEGKNSTTW